MSEPPQTPPPPEPPPPGPGRPAANFNANELKAAVQGADRYDLAIIGAGLVAFIFSLFQYYTISVNGSALGFGGSGAESAWHGFFGWFGTVVALAVALLIALRVVGIRLLDARTTRLACLGGFGVATVCALLALLIIPGKVDCQGIALCEKAIDYGHGVGYWVSLVAILAGLGLSYMRKDADA